MRSPAWRGEAVAAVPFGSASLPGGAGSTVGTASAALAVAAQSRTITQAEIAGRRRRCMARNLRTENGFGQCVRASFTRGDDGVIRSRLQSPNLEAGLEQADLAEDRDRVRVDVLALDQAVLERHQVHAAPLDPLAGRRGRVIAPPQRVRVRGGRGPLLGDEPVAHVEPARREPDVGPALEDPRDVRTDVLAL